MKKKFRLLLVHMDWAALIEVIWLMLNNWLYMELRHIVLILEEVVEA